MAKGSRRRGAKSTQTTAKRPEQIAAARGGRPLLVLLLILMIGAAAGGLMWEAAEQDSVTIDEFAHLPAGLYYLNTGRFNLYNLSPPLLRLWCALPAWRHGAPADFEQFTENPNHWQLGYNFMEHNKDQYQELFALARRPSIILALSLIMAVALVSWRAFGASAGVAAAILAAFCPNILAHGHLVTTDIGHALFLFLAVLAYEHALRAPSWRTSVFAGMVLGLAQLTKFSALVLYPLTMALTLIAWRQGLNPRRSWQTFAAVTLISLIVLNAGYGFPRVGAGLASYQLTSPQLQRLSAGFLGALPLPLPADFITGYDQQLAEAQGRYSVYFHGEVRLQGWWYYYPAAFALKTPLPMLVLLGIGVAFWITNGRARHDPLRSAVLFLPPALYVLLLVLTTDINLGLRYILPIYPFLFVIASSATAALWPRGTWARLVVAGLLIFQIFEIVQLRPLYLTYFNALAGGAANGYRWLVDSNLDWGQDLLRLRRYLDERSIPRVYLAYFGRPDPEVYDIDYERIDEEMPPGVYVVSASYLVGKPYYMIDHGTLYWVAKDSYSAFQDLQPSHVIGNTLFVYDLRGR